ncbi:MAG: hypothetical protein JSW00_08540 [Thermoplasmata archaeon]|nr:MAG: hypothetical protein JSW00_08540 [Thermoplasmata archaeon]
MEKDEIKFLKAFLNIVLIATIVIAFVGIPIIPKSVNAQSGYLVLQWSSNTGSDVLCVDISDGDSNASNVYVVAGSKYNLSVFDGSGNLRWYNNSITLSDFSTRGTDHNVAISGNAQYIVAGSSDGYVYVFDILGNLLWKDRPRGISSTQVYSVDVSNPLKNDINISYVVVSNSNSFYVYYASNGTLCWSQALLREPGYVKVVKISENGNWIGVCNTNKEIEFHNNTEPGHHSMIWSYNTTGPYVTIDIGRTGQVIVAGEDYPFIQNTSYVYKFDAGEDCIWGTDDDNVTDDNIWKRAEPDDIYAVAVSDCDTVGPAGSPFSVISGQTSFDNESEESYYYSPNKIRNWSTGIIWSAAATYDNNSAYNFRLFGTFSPENNVTLVAQDSDTIIDYYTTNGTVNTVAISYSYCQPTQYFDYFVAGSADDYVYFFTYAYP